MTTKLFRAVPLLLALAVLPVACGGEAGDGAEGGEEAGPAATQQGPAAAPGGPGAMNPATIQQAMEIQRIQRQLAPIQDSALASDPALRSQLDSVRVMIEQAMRAENNEAVDRIGEVESELAEAQAEGDQQRAQQLMLESQQLQQEIMAMQGRLLERPEIREPVQAFERAHRARMREINPQADSLLARMDELLSAMPR